MRVKRKAHHRKNTERIISLIYVNRNYLQLLSRDLKIPPTTLIGQLKKLEKEKFIVGKRVKRFNIKKYSLTRKGLLLFNYFRDLHKFELKYKEIINQS